MTSSFEMSRHYWGNMVRAWREGLDRDHNDRMDYNEFSVAVKDVGYAGNAQRTLAGVGPEQERLCELVGALELLDSRVVFPGIFSIGPFWSQKLRVWGTNLWLKTHRWKIILYTICTNSGLLQSSFWGLHHMLVLDKPGIGWSNPRGSWGSLWIQHDPILDLGLPFGMKLWMCEEMIVFYTQNSVMDVWCWVGQRQIICSNYWIQIVPDISVGPLHHGWLGLS